VLSASTSKAPTTIKHRQPNEGVVDCRRGGKVAAMVKNMSVAFLFLHDWHFLLRRSNHCLWTEMGWYYHSTANCSDFCSLLLFMRSGSTLGVAQNQILEGKFVPADGSEKHPTNRNPPKQLLV